MALKPEDASTAACGAALHRMDLEPEHLHGRLLSILLVHGSGAGRGPMLAASERVHVCCEQLAHVKRRQIIVKITISVYIALDRDASLTALRKSECRESLCIWALPRAASSAAILLRKLLAVPSLVVFCYA